MDLQQQKRIAEHFKRMHEQGITPWRNHPPELGLVEFFKLLKKEKPKAKILDIGCGDGWISIQAAKKDFAVWGIDASETAIKKAKKDALKERVEKKTHFQTGNALDLPYAANFFDALLDRGLFHHILPENRELYLKNIQRVLQKDAWIYLTVFSQKNPLGIGQLFNKELVEKIFAAFQTIKFREDPYPSPAPAHLLHFILKRLK